MIVSILLAALLVFAAVRKLSHRPEVVATYTRVGVPEARLDLLAWILLAGAAGLIAGLFWEPVGVAAGTGLVVYFLLAIAAHIRAGDTRNLPVPVAMELLAVASLIL
jgi:DoxX-like family